MNWGYKIAIVIFAFIGIMSSMVVVAFRQTNEVMEENYYDKELKYQTKIDAANALSDISTLDLITNSDGEMSISIPQQLVENFADGKIQFISMSKKSKDKTLPFTPNTDGVFKLSNRTFAEGRYSARISWNNNGKGYYKEQTIFIGK